VRRYPYTLMKAISIREPWAWLIIRPDLTDPIDRAKAFAAGRIKDIENRNWSTKVRGRVLVHAAKVMTRDEYKDVNDALSRGEWRDLGIMLPSFDEIPRGGIIGSVEIVDCLTQSNSRWFFGKYGFQLRNPEALPFRPLKGQLSFFDVPPEVFRL